MSEIAIDFLRGPDWSSRIIALGTNGYYSHGASVLKDGRYLDARSDVLKRVDPHCKVPDVVPAGVHIRDPMSEKWTHKQRATLQVTDQEYDDWEANLRAKITTEYDKDAILGFLEGKSMHTAGRWICSALAINGVQHVGRSWTSSGLFAKGMQHIGLVPFPLPVAAHQIAPNAALLILATAGFTIGPLMLPTD
jgi:hypothetical protein